MPLQEKNPIFLAIITENMEKFANLLKSYAEAFYPHFHVTTDPEKAKTECIDSYKGFLLGLLVEASLINEHTYIAKHCDVDEGTCDILLYPVTKSFFPAIVFRLEIIDLYNNPDPEKLSKAAITATAALEKYEQELADAKINRAILVGITCAGERLEIQHKKIRTNVHQNTQLSSCFTTMSLPLSPSKPPQPTDATSTIQDIQSTSSFARGDIRFFFIPTSTRQQPKGDETKRHKRKGIRCGSVTDDLVPPPTTKQKS